MVNNLKHQGVRTYMCGCPVGGRCSRRVLRPDPGEKSEMPEAEGKHRQEEKTSHHSQQQNPNGYWLGLTKVLRGKTNIVSQETSSQLLNL